MGRSCFVRTALLLVCITLLFSSGFGRKIVSSSGQAEHAVGASDQVESVEKMMELDYVEAGPNRNAKSGYLIPPPPPPGLGY